MGGRATGTAGAKTGTAGAVAVSITTHSNTVQMGISEKASTFIQGVAMVLSGFIIGFVKNWKLTLVTATILPTSILIYGISIPMDIKLEKAVMAAHEKAAALAEEVLASVRTAKSFNAEKRLGVKYKDLLEQGRIAGLRKSPVSGVHYFGVFFVIFGGYAICFWYGIKLFQQGEIKNPGTIISVFFAVVFAVMAFGNIAPPIQLMSKAASASASMFEVIDRTPLIDSLSTEGLQPENFPSGELELKNVKFAYPGGGERERVVVLGGDPDDAEGGEGMSLSFPEGKTTAIVGRSGSGKSTIVGLIERWYDPDVGSVSIAGIDIKDLNLRWWRGKIGLVMQEPFLFNESVFKNVAYGLTGTEWEHISDEEKMVLVKEACVEANAASFIEELPEAYQTRVGEQGIKISGGQKQRIAIARSIISKPQILILDEATSAIDPRNEKIVQEALDRISKGRTTITIAHRLSTVRKADRIVVIGAGNVLEVGTHEELLANPDGAYTQLVRGQTLLMQEVGEEEGEEEDLEIAKVGVTEGVDTARDTTLERSSTWRSRLSVNRGRAPAGDEEAAPVVGKKKVKVMGILRSVRLIGWEQRHLWPIYLLGFVGCLGGGAAVPIQAILFGKFMEGFEKRLDTDEFVKRQNHWALMFFILAIGVGMAYALMGSMFTSITHHINAYYRLEYFQNVLRQGIPFFDAEGNSAGTLTAQLNTHPAALQELLGPSTGLMLISIMSILGCCILALCIGWKLALVCICAALPFLFFAGLIRIRIEVGFAKDTAEVFEESAQFASEAVGAFRTVSSLIMEQSIRNRYDMLLKGHVKKSFKKTALASVIFSASENTSLLATALCFWYGGRLLANHELTTYEFYIIYISIIQGGEFAGQFFGFTENITQAAEAANRIFGKREKNPPPPGSPMPNGDNGCEVVFRDVNFKYPTRDTPIFQNLNLKIPAGSFAAFVGASGCGKTTTISLLERFYDPASGTIQIDGEDITRLDVESYRNSVSLVAQEPTLYAGTISENVRLGATTTSPPPTDEEIIQACKDAYIHEFITSLPDGYQTIVGAKGMGLSGGQKQRVAIARALVRKPRMLLLDEATASLDSESERFVQKAFEHARIGRTVVAVAHRLSTVQAADVIFVFDEGRVVESGRHGELVRARGVYYQMCQAQALDN
ncbi:P-loop containing nucleoside triphosphate hydrolase protein [Choiromyces venosus 120613-1]|uniref:P-loop containing nucleoside triphosphate hydrolase protein n=1 Tax=Choiromyces venosus 120613-1 TaxID=1336337 RepID=A0A3N4J7H5_9PEZI|nr:P-loop containing nucleoside triphosphate hydrolase protein [Choiromyces venosus 120613-1]